MFRLGWKNEVVIKCSKNDEGYSTILLLLNSKRSLHKPYPYISSNLKQDTKRPSHSRSSGSISLHIGLA